jgi:hypothetical protein
MCGFDFCGLGQGSVVGFSEHSDEPSASRPCTIIITVGYTQHIYKQIWLCFIEKDDYDYLCGSVCPT